MSSARWWYHRRVIIHLNTRKEAVNYMTDLLKKGNITQYGIVSYIDYEKDEIYFEGGGTLPSKISLYTAPSASMAPTICNNSNNSTSELKKPAIGSIVNYYPMNCIKSSDNGVLKLPAIVVDEDTWPTLNVHYASYTTPVRTHRSVPHKSMFSGVSNDILGYWDWPTV